MFERYSTVCDTVYQEDGAADILNERKDVSIVSDQKDGCPALEKLRTLMISKLSKWASRKLKRYSVSRDLRLSARAMPP
jgi:hypothetical protein